MAAVLVLVMLPAIAAVGFFLGAAGAHLSFATAFAMFTFFGLTSFVLLKTLKFAKDAEDEPA